jgi:hypothetical protein
MKVLDVIFVGENLLEGRKRKSKKKRKIPTWWKTSTFRKGPYGGIGWHAWGNNAEGNGGGDGGGGGE